MENLLSSIAQNMLGIFGLMAVGGAAYMVASKTAVHSVLAFLFAMLGIAGCFLSMNAEFLGMAQLLVYAGGIVVLFLFVVMLVEMTKYKEAGVFQSQARYVLPAVGIGVLVIAGAFRQALFGTPAAQSLTLKPEIAAGLDAAKNNAEAVSRGLFADFLLPFEILSIILLVALVGAVVLAKTERV
jgi:NADH-quinone oxidoreductase subunit J